jgi:tetratricopeptide (TPR) repeat protein
MYRLSFLLGLFHFFLSTLTYAQDLRKIDSLYQLVNRRTVDTAKVWLYRQIIDEYTISTKYLAKAKLITDTLCQMAEQLQDVSSQAACLDIQGVNLKHEGKNAEAIVLHEKALEIIKKVDDKYQEAYILNNIGFAYARLDDYQKAIDYHLQAQKIAETTNNLRNLANSMVSIGNCYRRMKRYELALTYFHRGLALEKTRNAKLGISINMNNI